MLHTEQSDREVGRGRKSRQKRAIRRQRQGKGLDSRMGKGRLGGESELKKNEEKVDF